MAAQHNADSNYPKNIIEQLAKSIEYPRYHQSTITTQQQNERGFGSTLPTAKSKKIMSNINSEKDKLDELPVEIHHKINSLDDSLTEVEEILKPFLRQPINDIKDKVDDPLENAKLDLMIAYTTNSLFWIYLTTQGIDPRTHPIKDELQRIKQYIGRVQSLQEKRKMARLDTGAVKRFVRGALWTPGQGTFEQTDESNKDKYEDNNATESNTNKETETDSNRKDKKRKRNDDETEKKNKKKKKKKNKDDN